MIRPKAIRLHRLLGEFSDHVDYAYPDGRKALIDITLDLPLGQVIAFVGP